MSRERWAWTTSQRIPSERGAGQQFIEEVLEQLKLHHWTSRDLFGVRLALEEAIVNAIKHGNSLDCRKEVRVECKLSSERIWIEIADEGCGFQPHKVPDPTHPDNLEKPSGRGIMLMRNYMNRVEYNETGNAVLMEKRRTTAR